MGKRAGQPQRGRRGPVLESGCGCARSQRCVRTREREAESALKGSDETTRLVGGRERQAPSSPFLIRTAFSGTHRRSSFSSSRLRLRLRQRAPWQLRHRSSTPLIDFPRKQPVRAMPSLPCHPSSRVASAADPFVARAMKSAARNANLEGLRRANCKPSHLFFVDLVDEDRPRPSFLLPPRVRWQYPRNP